MKRFLILALGLVCATTYAQNATEEAIILNQELQFLEDSINNVQSVSINATGEARRSRALNEPSLEKKYFGEDLEEDVVSTQTASPKRRGL